MTPSLQLLPRRLVRYSSSLEPVQHTHSAQGVPVAGPAFALVHVEVEIADAGTLRGDLAGRRLGQVAHRLPANRRVGVEQPVKRGPWAGPPLAWIGCNLR